jgi:hypothetical protein
MTPDTRADGLVRRITEYLACGGLHNPELMEHTKVRDLLMDCRAALAAPPAPDPDRWGVRGNQMSLDDPPPAPDAGLAGRLRAYADVLNSLDRSPLAFDPRLDALGRDLHSAADALDAPQPAGNADTLPATEAVSATVSVRPGQSVPDAIRATFDAHVEAAARAGVGTQPTTEAGAVERKRADILGQIGCDCTHCRAGVDALIAAARAEGRIDGDNRLTAEIARVTGERDALKAAGAP